jgi:hypothetical protein
MYDRQLAAAAAASLLCIASLQIPQGLHMQLLAKQHQGQHEHIPAAESFLNL